MTTVIAGITTAVAAMMIDGNSSDHGGDDSSRSKSMIPIFSENVGVVPDMSGKKPVGYYRLFISDHFRPHH